MKFLKKKKKGENYFNLIIEKEKNSDKKKRGRKASVNPSIIHNNMSEDNIIKKIKAKLFNYIIIFFNRILQKVNINDIKLLKLDYKYINNLSKIFELQLFTNKLKDLLYLDISSKYSSKSNNEIKDNNKNIIEKIENKTLVKNNGNEKIYDTLIFLLNLTYLDWLNLLTAKTSFNELARQNNVNEKSIDFNIIGNSFGGINEILSKFLKKQKDQQYFTSFVFLFFNYERWFMIKRERRRKKK